jgi:hypothetical protein
MELTTSNRWVYGDVEIEEKIRKRRVSLSNIKNGMSLPKYFIMKRPSELCSKVRITINMLNLMYDNVNYVSTTVIFHCQD